MAKTEKSVENLSIASKWFTIKVGAVDRAVALGAIAALTLLGVLYIYMTLTS